MAKLVARVRQVLRPGIHKVGGVRDGEVGAVADLSHPDRIEIEMAGGRGDPCMMFRYTEAGEFCGDTWHETLDAAFEEAEDEYGLGEADFSPADDGRRIEVFYNSACPVCKAGIEHQKGRVEGCAVAWRDVHGDNAAVADIGADLEFVRERLHAVDEDGRLRVGFDAFLLLWRESPKDRWKARLLGLPLVRQACRVAYNLFAAGLYRWNRAKKHW